MRVLDPGHLYLLDVLDAPSAPQLEALGVSVGHKLRFVKRVGSKYPGNEEPACGGTTTQEVLRALIERTKYVDGQGHWRENDRVLDCLRDALVTLELRAAKARGEEALFHQRLYAPDGPDQVEDIAVCETCQHLFCGRHDVA